MQSDAFSHGHQNSLSRVRNARGNECCNNGVTNVVSSHLFFLSRHQKEEGVLAINDRVTLYVENIGNKVLGSFHHYENGGKAYINNDMLSVLSHVIVNGQPLESFFPISLDEKLRNRLISQSQVALDELIKNGWIKDSDSISTKGKFRRITSSPPLRVLFVEATKECNLMCKHCYVADCKMPNKKGQLKTNDLKGLIKQADEMGVMEIQLTGGEIFMVQEVMDLMTDLRNRLIPCSVFTNGTIIPHELLDFLKNDCNGFLFYISLDGPENIHDEFRQVRGCYAKTITAIRTLLNIGCDVRINTAVGKHNANCILEFMDYIKNEFGVMHRLVPIEPIGRAKDQQLTIPDKQFSELLAGSGKNFKFLDSHDELSDNDWEIPACGVGSSMIFIDAYGNASLCPTLTQAQNPDFLAGNIKESTIYNIWTSSQIFKKIRNIQCSEINRCTFKELCRGGCRSKAFLETGDLCAPDKQMCDFYKIAV